MLNYITKFLSGRQGSEGGQLATKNNKSKLKQLLIFMSNEGIIAKTQVEPFINNPDLSTQQKLAKLDKILGISMTTPREKRGKDPSAITVGGKRVTRSITLTNSVTRENVTVPLPNLFTDYVPIADHSGIIQLLVSNTHILDFEKGEYIQRNTPTQLSNPMASILNILIRIGEEAYRKYTTFQEKQFVSHVQRVTQSFRNAQERFQTGRAQSDELLLLNNILSVNSVNSLRTKLGSQITNSLVGLKGSTKYKLYEELYSVEFRESLLKFRIPGEIENIKKELSSLQIEELKERLTDSRVEPDISRMKRIALMDLIIAMKNISSVQTQGVQMYTRQQRSNKPGVKNATQEAVSANINRAAQRWKISEAAAAAAAAARNRNDPDEVTSRAI